MKHVPELSSRIENAIEDAFTWAPHRKMPDEPWRYTTREDPIDLYTDTFTREELESCDARLPMVLDHLFEKQLAVYNNRVPQVEGYHVRRTLNYWNSPKIVLPPEAHAKDADQQLPKVMYFSGGDAMPKFFDYCMQLKFCEYYPKRTPCGIDYVDAANDSGALVSYEWMNQAYPGWRERYDVAVSLGATMRDCMINMFTQNPVVTMDVDMTGIDTLDVNRQT